VLHVHGVGVGGEHLVRARDERVEVLERDGVVDGRDAEELRDADGFAVSSATWWDRETALPFN